MRQRLVNLKSSDYEHPFDNMALKSVNAIPLLPTVVEKAMNLTTIRWSVIAMCGSNFHVTSSACPQLYAVADDVFKTLDLETIPDLYMEQDYYINAYTTGHKQSAYIVVSTGSVDKLSDDELQFVIGHEAGHVKSGHVLYHLMTAFLSQILQAIPGGTAVGLPLQTALLYWNRMSEFTADRAGLLACQDLDVALNAIMKMSGLPERFYGTSSVEGFKKQAKEFEHRYGSSFDEIIKGLTIICADHPWTVVRAAQLIKWVEEGGYDDVLNGIRGKICPNCGYTVPEEALKCPICGSNF